MCKGYRKYSITKEEILNAEREMYDHDDSEFSYSEDESEDDSYVEESSTESDESESSSSISSPPPSPLTSDIYDAIPGVPNLCTMAHFNQYLSPPWYFGFRSWSEKEFFNREPQFREEVTSSPWFLQYSNDYTMHPKYFPPSMLESESISFDQGRPVYAPGVKEPEIPAVVNGIDFKDDIEQNSNIFKNSETGEMQQCNDMKMCISFDNRVTKMLCKISGYYSRPMVDEKEEMTFNPGSYHCVKQLHNIALNELDQRHRGIFPIKETLVDFDMVNHRKYECPKLLHLHPLSILRQRPRLKCTSLHNLDSYILNFYPKLTTPTMCVNSIVRLANITSWFAYHAYTKTINMIDGITTPIYANRKQAMVLYFPWLQSQKMTKVKIVYNGKKHEIFKNVFKPPIFDNNRHVIKANTRYVLVTCRQSLYKKHFENFHKELRNKSKDNH